MNMNAFFETLKRKERESRKQRESIKEVQPDEEEIEIINEYENCPEKFEFISMKGVLKELGIDGSDLNNWIGQASVSQ